MHLKHIKLFIDPEFERKSDVQNSYFGVGYVNDDQAWYQIFLFINTWSLNQFNIKYLLRFWNFELSWRLGVVEITLHFKPLSDQYCWRYRRFPILKSVEFYKLHSRILLHKIRNWKLLIFIVKAQTNFKKYHGSSLNGMSLEITLTVPLNCHV